MTLDIETPEEFQGPVSGHISSKRGLINSSEVKAGVTYILAEVPLGWVADRLGKRPLLIAGPATLALSFAVLGRATSFETCLWAMAVTGAGHAMISGVGFSNP